MKTWKEVLGPVWKSHNVQQIETLITKAEASGKEIYPYSNLRYQALKETTLADTKVVILGQDPYHNFSEDANCPEAMGLAFSVPDGIKIPSSLRNIFKEIISDVYDSKPISPPKSGNLTYLASQGVLLLNTSLSVEAHNANSHKDLKWDTFFTDHVIRAVSEEQENCVFILWGAKARNKKGLIDPRKHLILESAHPSGLSASRGFYGSRPFTKTNQYLISNSKLPIKWIP